MNLYEHTIVARQDVSPSEIKQITEKYSNIVTKNNGEIIQTQNWGLIKLLNNQIISDQIQNSKRKD